MDRSIAIAVSSATTTTASGIFQRHASPRQRPLSGSASGGRWGAENTYPVLYLARPTDSVIVEAYYGPCHLVAQAAHQLELHGFLAPAATGAGETLAIFERRLPAEEQPEPIDVATWDGLPADPRPSRSSGFNAASGSGSGDGPGDEAGS